MTLRVPQWVPHGPQLRKQSRELAQLGKKEDAVPPASEELEDATVSQDLKLLANLRPNVPVVLVLSPQSSFERVHIVEGELGLVDLPNAHEHVRHPATRLGGRFSKKRKGAPCLANRFYRELDSIPHSFESGIGWKAGEEEIAAYPARPSGRRSERRTLLDERRGEEMSWHEEQVPDGPF